MAFEQQILNDVWDSARRALRFVVDSLPLPNGAATSANQTNGNQISKPFLIDENGVKSQMLGDTYFVGAPVVVDAAHHEIHCGDMLEMSHVVDLGNGAVRDILIIVPNPVIAEKRYHFDISVTSELETNFKLYEATTTSANGTALAVYNKNRQDPVVAENEILMFHTPTVTGVGTLLEECQWGSGRAFGGSNRTENEWVLKNNTRYLIRITNAITNNNHICLKINYYVHPGV